MNFLVRTTKSTTIIDIPREKGFSINLVSKFKFFYSRVFDRGAKILLVLIGLYSARSDSTGSTAPPHPRNVVC